MGLSQGLRLVGRLGIAQGIDQNDFQLVNLEEAVQPLLGHQSNGQQHRMHQHRQQQADLQHAGGSGEPTVE